MDDEIIILGSGGGRHHIRTQKRATGGIIFKTNEFQAHIDPGPGAIVRINQYGEDPTKTDVFIVTHVHIDHFNDINVIIEASRNDFYDKDRNIIQKGTLITTSDTLQYVSNYHKNMLEKVVCFKAGDIYHYKNAIIIGTRVLHDPKVEGFGIRFELDGYSIAFSSDTMVFDGFSEQFSKLNILVLNLLRPDSITCKRHLCTDEVIPFLNKIEPPLDSLILTHFGSFMDGSRSSINNVPSQVQKLKENTIIKKIIPAEDGLKIKIDDLL